MPKICLPAAPLAELGLDPAHLSILLSHPVVGDGELVVGHAGAVCHWPAQSTMI